MGLSLRSAEDDRSGEAMTRSLAAGGGYGVVRGIEGASVFGVHWPGGCSNTRPADV